ncbi:MAG: NUDIX domain-containing protein [Clostridia bacterium]|nr:NUDIX domain-containing protein [Clostridia bacterium]
MEIWDILDEEGNKTWKTMQKGEKVPNGFYHLGADVWIVNSENKILIQKRSSKKRQAPNVWAMTGGSVVKGETSLQTIERETIEELGIQLNKKELQLIKHYKTGEVCLDTYLIRQDIKIDDIIMQEDEVSDVKWATYEEIEELFQNHQFLANRWEFVRYLMKAIQYIGKEVEVKVERTIGSSHLEYPETIYPINYGFVPKTMSGDGEELDCYILGEDKPVKQYRGKCIAVIHRLEEDDDKLIIAPNNKNFTNEEIKQLTYFQERHFKSIVIR